MLAPGEAILGATPGGGTAELTGSSFATPIVSGLVGLLLSVQLQHGRTPDPRHVREAILSTATPCQLQDEIECARYLAGTLNVSGAYALTTRGGRITMGDHDVGASSQSLENAASAVQLAVSGAETTGVVPSAAPLSSEAPEQPNAPAGEPVQPDASPAPRVAAQAAAAIPSGPSAVTPAEVTPTAVTPAADASVNGASVTGVQHPVSAPVGVRPASECSCNDATAKSNIFAIGNIGFDFGTEARRDTFRQLMPRPAGAGSPPVFYAPNAYDPGQLADYLDEHPSESTKLIWTLTLDLTPVYAIEAEVSYAEEVYQQLRVALRNQALSPTEHTDYVSRVSIAGVLTARTRRLFSGQVVPIVVAQPRGLYTWNETLFVDAVLEAVSEQAANVSPKTPAPDPDFTRRMLRSFLDKAYYELRNLGQSSPDRAINFAATNAFLFGTEISTGILSPMTQPGQTNRFTLTGTGQIERAQPTLGTLDTITATKSAYCRVDSDCWDVRLSFFDPENSYRARTVFLMTIDVSDELPVTLAPTHQFLVAS